MRAPSGGGSGELFDGPDDSQPAMEPLAPGAVILRGYARQVAQQLIDEVARIASAAPFRHLLTPGGRRMSVAMTNSGPLGWLSDARRYRYDPADPQSGRPWPQLPATFLELAGNAAAQAGYAHYVPDACLINRYEPGAQLTLHQDRDEQDASAPIVSVSLGLPAIFLFGGATRVERPQRLRLAHGDVVVWGGASRYFFHGVAPLVDGMHAATGRSRVNLTFRKAR